MDQLEDGTGHENRNDLWQGDGHTVNAQDRAGIILDLIILHFRRDNGKRNPQRNRPWHAHGCNENDGGCDLFHKESEESQDKEGDM